MRYQKNHNFFAEKSNLNSYWAGFIAADGNISTKGNSLSIRLSAKDTAHLQRLSDLLSGDYKLRPEIRTLNGKDYPTIGFSLASPQWKLDLLNNWKITPKKSMTLEFPHLDSVENRKSFICGYIDGDGCICVSNNKIAVQILGTRSFLSSILEFLTSQKIVTGNNINVREHKQISTLSFGSTTAIAVLDFLHDSDLPLLDRKWDKFLTHKRNRIYRKRILWSDEDNQTLRDNHATMSVRQVQEKFFPDRTYTSVEKRCNYLGLKKHYEQKWTAEEKVLISEQGALGKGPAEIRREHFAYRTYGSVKNMLRKVNNNT